MFRASSVPTKLDDLHRDSRRFAISFLLVMFFFFSVSVKRGSNIEFCRRPPAQAATSRQRELRCLLSVQYEFLHWLGLALPSPQAFHGWR